MARGSNGSPSGYTWLNMPVAFEASRTSLLVQLRRPSACGVDSREMHEGKPRLRVRRVRIGERQHTLVAAHDYPRIDDAH